MFYFTCNHGLRLTSQPDSYVNSEVNMDDDELLYESAI